MRLLVESVAAAAEKGPEETAEAAFILHHELAVRSGNMLFPMLYHAFKATALSLWVLYCRHNENGCVKLYENKRNLYEALIDKDLPRALEFVAGEYPGEYKDYTWPVALKFNRSPPHWYIPRGGFCMLRPNMC